MSIKKTIEPTGDLCIKFTEEEMAKIGIKAGDKFSYEEVDGGFALKKFATIDLDLSEWDKDILIELIRESCEKDISINEVITNILENYCDILNND